MNSLGRYLVEKGAEEVAFLSNRVHVAWNNCINQKLGLITWLSCWQPSSAASMYEWWGLTQAVS
jgi:hypothetical protein